MALTYDQRLKTFTPWPHGTPSASAMAAAGFMFIGKTNVHDGQADAVKCLDCKSLLEPWWDHYVPFTKHAGYKPDCPFVIAQQQSAAFKAASTASTQLSGSTSRNPHHQCSDILTQPDVLAKLQTQAKRDAEEISRLNAEVQTLVKDRSRANMGFVAAQYGREEDFAMLSAKIKDARADAADALLSKEALEAAHAAEIQDLNLELKALKSMAVPLQTAKGTFEAAHGTEVRELKTEIKALTTSVTPLQAAIEGLAASITRLQVGKVTVDYESVSEMNGKDHHAGVIAQTPAKEPIDDYSSFSAETSPSPSDHIKTENVNVGVGSECESEAEMNEAEVDGADVHTQNQDDSSASNADADTLDAWDNNPNENDSNNSPGPTEDSLNDNVLASDDSWLDLESVSPSSNGPDSVDDN